MIRQLRVNQDFSLHWGFEQTWPAVHVVRVIEQEQCYFDSTPDPFNGQTANFIVKPPRVIESRSYFKKANLEGYWNNTVDIYSRSILVWGRRRFAFLIFIDLWSCLLTTFQYCQPAQNQPISQFLLHKNCSPCALFMLASMPTWKSTIWIKKWQTMTLTISIFRWNTRHDSL